MSEPDRELRAEAAGTLERDLRIDSSCSRFEAALKAGERPDVDDYLADAPDNLRGSLEVELRQVLNAFRASAGEHTEPSSFADTVVTADTRIGPYTLVEKLGEGGMGEVWSVRQEVPVKRVAALKFIKAGMDSRSVLARFEQERQALALLDHPNIARVLDAGMITYKPEARAKENAAIPSLALQACVGRPYFVMELVNGQPLTKFCDNNRLGISQRLELFVNICQAVQHAHQKGIVHRDLKPSNILVSQVDPGAPGLVKVIDFGVAKVLGESLTNETLSTHPGMVVGTLEYMAPEQAGTSGVDIDTRADIYSLGVILYELLTGLRPFDGQRLRKVPFDELIRIIREEEPPRPSTRLSSDSSQPALTAARRTEPKSLTALLRGDLDWIVMKCLEKNRVRRYESASSLARDIERYLASEPVEARPPSAVYRVQKFVRRNTGPVLAASMVLAALIAAIVGTTWGLVQARVAEAKAVGERNEKELARREEERQKQEAKSQKNEADRQRTKADKARDEAQRRLTQIEKGNEILSSVFDDLDLYKVQAGPEALDVILGRKLKRAAALLDEDSIADPLVVAVLQNRLGNALYSLGHAPEALELFEKSLATNTARLGPNHSDTLTSLSNVANTYHATGRFAEALPLLERVAKLKTDTLGVEHPETQISNNNLAGAAHALGKYDLALPLFEQTLKHRKATSGDHHPDTCLSMSNLAECYLSMGKIAKALELHKETLAHCRQGFGAEHPQTLSSMSNLASAYLAAGQLDLALPLFEEALRLKKARLGFDHPATLATMTSLGSAYESADRLDLALPLLTEALDLRKAKLGPEHPDTLSSMHNLAAAYDSAEKLDLALPLFEETLKLRQAKLGVDHPDTLHSMNGLAVAYEKTGKLTEALQLHEEILPKRKAKLGSDHPDTLNSMGNLAAAYDVAGKPDLALPLFEDTLNRMERVLGLNHDSRLTVAHNLAEACRRSGNLKMAMEIHEKTLERRRAALGNDHLHTLFSMNNLAETYFALGRVDVALPLYEETSKLAKAKLGPDHVKTLVSLNNLAKGYQATGKFDLAIATFTESLLVLRTKLGAENPSTIVVMNNLAECYSAAGKSELAIPLFQEALKSSVDNQGLDHPATLNIFGNFLTAYGKAGLVEKEESLLLEMLAAYRQALPPRHVITLQVLDQLAQRQIRLRHFVEAEKSLRECLPGFQEEFPEVWFTFEKQAMLGEALLGQKKYADAEPFLVQGYAGMKARKETIPEAEFPKLALAVESLMALYSALDKPAEIEKWRAERALYPAKSAAPPAAGP